MPKCGSARAGAGAPAITIVRDYALVGGGVPRNTIGVRVHAFERGRDQSAIRAFWRCLGADSLSERVPAQARQGSQSERAGSAYRNRRAQAALMCVGVLRRNRSAIRAHGRRAFKISISARTGVCRRDQAGMRLRRWRARPQNRNE
eukprot:6857016-Pyramimonas_sp.AAC.1